MERSKLLPTLWLACHFAAMLLPFLRMWTRDNEWIAQLLRAMVYSTSMGSTALAAILLHDCWKTVIEASARHRIAVPSSAGRMVGLLFVPLFNFYWLFRAFGGFSSAIDEVFRREGRHERMPELGMGVAIGFIVTSIATAVARARSGDAVAVLVATVAGLFTWVVLLPVFLLLAWELSLKVDAIVDGRRGVSPSVDA